MENLIKLWQENWLPWCKVSAEMKAVAEKIGKEQMEYWQNTDAVFFKALGMGVAFSEGCVYQLPDDFQCPHGELRETIVGLNTGYAPVRTICVKICAWCGDEVPDKPKMGWVEIPVLFDDSGCYYFRRNDRDWELYTACSFVGFGGMRFNSPVEGSSAVQWSWEAPTASNNSGPWIPVAVRFWEAMK